MMLQALAVLYALFPNSLGYGFLACAVGEIRLAIIVSPKSVVLPYKILNEQKFLGELRHRELQAETLNINLYFGPLSIVKPKGWLFPEYI